MGVAGTPIGGLSPTIVAARLRHVARSGRAVVHQPAVQRPLQSLAGVLESVWCRVPLKARPVAAPVTVKLPLRSVPALTSSR
jgi:hypothetical protein